MNGVREVLKRGHRSSEAFRRVERLQLDLALKLYRYLGVCRFCPQICELALFFTPAMSL